jgi:hypothetical protein
MFSAESEMSRKLTIALWNINRDPIFIECLEQARSVQGNIFLYAHVWQVLRLDDERAVGHSRLGNAPSATSVPQSPRVFANPQSLTPSACLKLAICDTLVCNSSVMSEV